MDSADRQRRPRVLVVDDCPDTVESLARMLRLWGFDATAARDGPGALELADSYRPAVVLMDLGLAGMDGFEVARRISGRPKATRPALVCLSGWCGEDVQRRCLEAGFDLHVSKPADPELLRRLLIVLSVLWEGDGARRPLRSETDHDAGVRDRAAGCYS